MVIMFRSYLFIATFLRRCKRDMTSALVGLSGRMGGTLEDFWLLLFPFFSYLLLLLSFQFLGCKFNKNITGAVIKRMVLSLQPVLYSAQISEPLSYRIYSRELLVVPFCSTRHPFPSSSAFDINKGSGGNVRPASHLVSSASPTTTVW